MPRTGASQGAASKAPPRGRLIGLGVTGSIAAYKAVELLRLLRAEGADVAVMLTPSATRFVGPLSFAALSRHPVETDVLDLLPDGRIGHIVVADTADAIVVAPATAHWLGRDGQRPGRRRRDRDLPRHAARRSSSRRRWTATCGRHPATQANVARLRDAFGYTIVEPEPGRSPPGSRASAGSPSCRRIVDAVVAAVADRPVRAPDPAARPPLVAPPATPTSTGRHIVVTAGGTREAIDPVRFIGNRSTGQDGRRDRRGRARPRRPR